MIPSPLRTAILAGAGGGAIDPKLFCSTPDEAAQISAIFCPGWRRYVEEDFSAEKLVEELAAQIATRTTDGPIRIIGASLGGHLGYAAALRLQTSGREIRGFCAIDAFAVTSAATSAGWTSRAFRAAAELLGEQRLPEFSRFAKSRFWRAALQLSGDHLKGLVRKAAPSGRLPKIFDVDPLFEEELSMRLLVRAVAPWVAALDDDPAPLRAPGIFMRTASAARADLLWRRRCPQLKVVEIGGDHDTMFSPENASSFRHVARQSGWEAAIYGFL